MEEPRLLSCSDELNKDLEFVDRSLETSMTWYKVDGQMSAVIASILALKSFCKLHDSRDWLAVICPYWIVLAKNISNRFFFVVLFFLDNYWVSVPPEKLFILAGANFR